MRVIRPRLKEGDSVDWVIASHDDGRFSLAFKADKMRLRRRGKKIVGPMDAVYYKQGINLPVEVDGVEMRPTLIVRLVFKASPSAVRRAGGKMLLSKNRK